MAQFHNIIWKGYAYASKEHCSIAIGGNEILINGKIKSRPADLDLTVSYSLRLNTTWETQSVRIAGTFDNKAFDYDFQREGQTWTNWDGTELSGGLEPDISLTPLTNTLAIRRLKMQVGQSAEIAVLYFDLAERVVDIRSQRYTRIGDRQYRFETVPADFEAVIDVDDDNLVTQYPELFTRI